MLPSILLRKRPKEQPNTSRHYRPNSCLGYRRHHSRAFLECGILLDKMDVPHKTMRRSDMFQEVIVLLCRKGTTSVPTRPHRRIQFNAMYGGRSRGFAIFLTLSEVNSLSYDSHLWSVNNKQHSSIAILDLGHLTMDIL